MTHFNQSLGGFDLWAHLKGIQEAFRGVRMNFKPSMRELLKLHGDKLILECHICRRPLSSKFNVILNLVNKISGSSPIPHDKLFHLMLVLKLSDGTLVQLEKNEDLNIDYFKKSPVDEVRRVIFSEPKTINTLLNNAINAYGDRRIFVYDAFTNNCQRFVLDILTANNIYLSPDDVSFILQDVKNLVPDWSKRFAYSITSFYNRLKMAIQGYGMIGKIPKSYCVACGGRVKNMKLHKRSNTHIKKILRVHY